MNNLFPVKLGLAAANVHRRFCGETRHETQHESRRQRPFKSGVGRREVAAQPALGRRLLLTVCGLIIAGSGCGYRPAYGGTRPSGRLTVTAAPSRAPEGGALTAVLSGVRGELSRAGVLASGSGYPRVVVELVRVDERGTAQTLLRQAEGNQLPLASGALVGVTARAWVEAEPSRVERDSGDIRRTAAFGSAANAGVDAATREAALMSAGRATGEAIGRRVLGEIDVTQEPM